MRGGQPRARMSCSRSYTCCHCSAFRHACSAAFRKKWCDPHSPPMKEGADGKPEPMEVSYLLMKVLLMKELRHRNIVPLLDVFKRGDSVELVFPFAPNDLKKVIDTKSIPLGKEHIKAYMQMTLEGIAFLHESWVLHRDMKPENLLVGAAALLLPPTPRAQPPLRPA